MCTLVVRYRPWYRTDLINLVSLYLNHPDVYLLVLLFYEVVSFLKFTQKTFCVDPSVLNLLLFCHVCEESLIVSYLISYLDNCSKTHRVFSYLDHYLIPLSNYSSNFIQVLFLYSYKQILPTTIVDLYTTRVNTSPNAYIISEYNYI